MYFKNVPFNRNLQNILSASYTNDSESCESQANKPNLISTAKMLRNRHGMGIFVRGMAPKMLQAGVNHSITFYVYDLILNMFAA